MRHVIDPRSHVRLLPYAIAYSRERDSKRPENCPVLSCVRESVQFLVEKGRQPRKGERVKNFRKKVNRIIYYGTRLSENISRREPEGYLFCLNVPVARTGTQEYLPEELGLPPGTEGTVLFVRVIVAVTHHQKGTGLDCDLAAEILSRLDQLIALLTATAPAADEDPENPDDPNRNCNDDPIEEIVEAVEEAVEAAVAAENPAQDDDDPDEPILSEAGEEGINWHSFLMQTSIRICQIR